MLEVIQRTYCCHIVTVDESWFCLEYQYARQWSVSCNGVLQRVNPVIGAANFLSTTILGVIGFHVLDLAPS
jgi:hypothetical protein